MLKVSIVGCGKIADSHASQILRIKGCELVGACDREELMAKQLCERFAIKQAFSDLEEMLLRSRPDVVHITTPPASHYAIASRCLEHGCHVYVEKPFTVNAEEGEELIRLAQERKRKITVGHDDQFRHVARRMRQTIADGYLGGDPVHMESHYCYEMNESSSYAKALLTDKNHWVRALPGQLLQNIISHGVARIAEFLKDDCPEVIAHGFVSPMLRRMGESEIVDELRVIISERDRVTAYFTFSSQMRPSLHQFRIYGPKNGLLLDQDNETLVRLRGSRYTSYLEQFVPPVTFARQYLGNLAFSIRKFLGSDFHPKAGMKYLIEQFYAAVRGEREVPIAYREILLTSRIMDEIFRQLSSLPQADVTARCE